MPVFAFFTEKPPEPEWHSIFDNTKWEPDEPDNDYGEWTGSSWFPDDRNNDQPGGDYTVFLRPMGSWSTGFRPTKMRITYSIILMRYYIRDTSDNIIASGSSYASGAEIDLDFDTYGLDIGTMDLRDFPSSWYITNIEFFGFSPF